MNLSSPLDGLLGPLETAAVRVLSSLDTALTGRHIARLASAASPENMRRALLRLADVGIVTSQPMSNAILWAVNRDHLLWPAIDLALRSEQTLEQRIATFVGDASVPVLAVSLYGSVARGDSTRDSDIDVVVVLDDATPSDARDEFVVSLASAIERWTGNVAQIYDLTRQALRDQHDAGDPIVLAWLREERPVVGAGIAALVPPR